MYNLIDQFAKEIVSTIPPEHVTEYDWLLQNVGHVSTPGYQQKYRSYWALNVARLNPSFYRAYFNALGTAPTQKPTLSNVVHILYNASTNRSGRKSLQFSFATKLLHMANPQLPLYSSEVTAFFFFELPAGEIKQRLTKLVAFHDFLIREYARVLKNGLLAGAIQEFRLRLRPQHFTDEKVVDSLIWAFVAKQRGLLKNQIMNG